MADSQRPTEHLRALDGKDEREVRIGRLENPDFGMDEENDEDVIAIDEKAELWIENGRLEDPDFGMDEENDEDE